MNENTSRRTWLQILVATLFGLLAVRISPTTAAMPAPPKPNPGPEPAAEEILIYDSNTGPHGSVTEYTYDSQGRLTSIAYGPGTDDPDIKTFTYEV